MDEGTRELNVGIRRAPELQKGAWGMFVFPNSVPAEYTIVASATLADVNTTFHIYTLPNDKRTVQATMRKPENNTAFELMLRGALAAADNPDKPIRLREMKRKQD